MNDGDTSLVVADKSIVNVAKRNMEGVVPLYYEMKKANPTILTSERFYDGMSAAWSGGNIGAISNNITKIWNKGGDITKEDELAVKLQCMENNFCIDFAKTLYKPTRPPEIHEFLSSYTKAKTPHFFKYAKDKSENQVEPVNNSIVNRFERLIKDKRISFKHMMDFDYKMLLDGQNITYFDSIINIFLEENQKYHNYIRNTNVESEDIGNIPYVRRIILERLTYDSLLSFEYIANMLIDYVYKNHKDSCKKLLWIIFGDVIYANLQKNLAGWDNYCMNCGRRFKSAAHNHKYCDNCADAKVYKQKTLVCVDCGKEFKIPIDARKRQRCDDCKAKHDKEKARLRKQKQRAEK